MSPQPSMTPRKSILSTWPAVKVRLKGCHGLSRSQTKPGRMLQRHSNLLLEGPRNARGASCASMVRTYVRFLGLSGQPDLHKLARSQAWPGAWMCGSPRRPGGGCRARPASSNPRKVLGGTRPKGPQTVAERVRLIAPTQGPKSHSWASRHCSSKERLKFPRRAMLGMEMHAWQHLHACTQGPRGLLNTLRAQLPLGGERCQWTLL